MESALPPSRIETISADLRLILRAMLAVLGMWKLPIPQIVLTHRRISLTFQRIERLLRRFEAGRLRPMVARTRASGRRKATPASVSLPRRFGWLVAAGGYQAAGYGSQLQHLVLNTPEMLALLDACPQAKRILRPLCRALMIDLPWVRGEARKPRARKPRPKPEPDASPLPRGWKTWIRKEKRMEKLIKLKHELVAKMAQERGR